MLPAVSATFVNSMRSGTEAPNVLLASIDTSTVVPVAESAGRFPPIWMLAVVTGEMVWPTGILIGPTLALELTLPVASACQPCTRPPSPVTSCPRPSSEKLPLRV